MKPVKAELRYKKIARRYVPVDADTSFTDNLRINVGEFVLTQQCEDSTRYHYRVSPNRIEALAVFYELESAIKDAITDAVRPKPTDYGAEYTKQQKAVIKAARKQFADAGIAMPSSWEVADEISIVRAALSAIREALR
jgi:hypothetical protein